jgi:hypothetical protein
MEKVKVLTIVRILLFNIAETCLIFLLGKLFNVDVNIRIMFMGLFFIVRMIAGTPKHYKKAYQCALWSSLVFLSLYTLSTLELPVIILLTIFTALISTGRADINDMFMWKGKNSKYSDIEEYIKYNSMETKLIEYEKKLKEKDNLTFLIYKYRFKDKMTFAEISERLDLENPRIAEKLEQIAFSFRIFFGI